MLPNLVDIFLCEPNRELYLAPQALNCESLLGNLLATYLGDPASLCAHSALFVSVILYNTLNYLHLMTLVNPPQF
jgi:hypothetical protein